VSVFGKNCGIGDSVHVGRFRSLEDVAYGELYFFPAAGVGDRRDAENTLRYMARAGVLSQGISNPPPQVVVYGDIGSRHDEQDYLNVPGYRPANYQAVGDLTQRFHDAIDLSGPNANSSRIESGIAATVDDDAPNVSHGAGYFDVVSMSPPPGEALEVGSSVPTVIGIVVQERHRSGRKGCATDKFAVLSEYRLTALVGSDNVHA